MSSAVNDKKIQASRALARKQRALNKILYWVNDGDLYEEKEDISVRPPGLPTANHIEDRRLKGILFELGKKRQQFIEHAEYEKQQFIEGQRRKSKELRRAWMSSGTASRGWSVAESSLTREETEILLADDSGVIAANSGQKRMQVRLGLMTDKQNSVMTDDFKERTLDREKPKHVQFITTPMESRDMKSKPYLERLPSIIKERGRSRSPGSITLPWDKMKSNAMEPDNRLPPLLSDPRFRKLETHLSPLYETERTDIAVEKVISNMEALHIPPKTKRVSRSLKEQMIKQFLTEQGFAF